MADTREESEDLLNLPKRCTENITRFARFGMYTREEVTPVPWPTTRPDHPLLKPSIPLLIVITN